jgi:vancomycin resistance protein VanJ
MINVMTLNIGNGLTPGPRLVAWLRASGAGVIGLQEVDERQAEAIRSQLADVYPYQVLHGTGFCGRGLLSRYPIVAHDLLELREGRFDLRARVALPGVEATVIVAHPLPPKLQLRGFVSDPETGVQVSGLLDLALRDAPAIVMGDFNMTSRNPLYDQLRSGGLIDAFETSGSGAGSTFPVRPGKIRRVNHRMHWLPLVAVTRIDYIWHTPEFRSLDAWVGANVGSDHLPVLARLSLPRQPIVPASLPVPALAVTT